MSRVNFDDLPFDLTQDEFGNDILVSKGEPLTKERTVIRDGDKETFTLKEGKKTYVLTTYPDRVEKLLHAMIPNTFSKVGFSKVGKKRSKSPSSKSSTSTNESKSTIKMTTRSRSNKKSKKDSNKGKSNRKTKKKSN